jgi:hypothetical protein
MRTAIVTTTINVPTFLKGYADNIEKYGNEDVIFVVVGDKKSPPETRAFCETIPNCFYLDIAHQYAYMRDCALSDLYDHLPFNSVERRNIGMLWAYRRGSGADIIISIDDDNYATAQDAIAAHQIVGTSLNLPTYGTNSGWFNTCDFLREEHDVRFYPRGYSPKNRWNDALYTSLNYVTRKVVVNAGFWLEEPDIDAITRMDRKLRVTGYKYPPCSMPIALTADTWCPFNNQNTALAREVIPAYFLTPHIGRHSDIFASYVIARLADHFNDAVAFGDPLALHNRQPHNLWNDFDIEREGIIQTDDFCTALRNIPLSADTYHEGFGQIAEGLDSWATTPLRKKIVEGMKIWHAVFQEIK